MAKRTDVHRGEMFTVLCDISLRTWLPVELTSSANTLGYFLCSVVLTCVIGTYLVLYYIYACINLGSLPGIVLHTVYVNEYAIVVIVEEYLCI